MFKLPPLIKNANGQTRKAGFEIEYAGLKPLQCAHIVQSLFGGQVEVVDEYETIIKQTEFGDFSIYLDSVYLRKTSEHYLFKDFDLFKELIYSLSELVIPYEIVTPPIPFNKLQSIEQLKENLRKNGALGTGASTLYAFGMHINIEAPSFEAEILLNILRSFVLLQDYISEKIDVDLTRKLTWFIEPFEQEYIDLILDFSYTPDFEHFANDYIFYNPTRNRALDLLPLLIFIEPSLKEKLPEQKLNPRPAFHYRLPNSKIDDPTWSIAFEFNQWSLVEKVAFDKQKLYDLMHEYQEFQHTPLWFIKDLWIDKVYKWLEKNGLL
ncbi:amidoligase family protein [Nitratiruptor tergarcus]|uniref:Putative amidoligase enzyme n=1 Tax=Nitratiruptor tergarcus DSM 16512 TaxID=1069081 RepID=A0A1W1WVB1_9BACT|nr:amidoligase family protein [Nitratiruptor tergarcus]SMC10122.1 Putative amidoligase enzyme [Nitratiruptor tergarcus DSM 16512]